MVVVLACLMIGDQVLSLGTGALTKKACAGIFVSYIICIILFFLFDHKWYFFLSWFVLLQLKYENENKHNYRNLRLNIWAYFVSKVSASGSSTSLINTDGNLALQPVKPGLSFTTEKKLLGSLQ